MKTSQAQRMRNRSINSQMKKAIKELESSANRAEAENRLKDVVSIIDKASQKNIIHKNKAARDKSRLTNFVRNLSN